MQQHGPTVWVDEDIPAQVLRVIREAHWQKPAKRESPERAMPSLEGVWEC